MSFKTNADTEIRSYDIAVVGDWHLAFVSSAVLASCGHKVALVKPLNINSTKWDNFPSCPVIEPGLEDMISKATAVGNLFFENGISNAWTAKFVWMAIDTPVNEKDEPNVEPLIQVLSSVKDTQKNLKCLITSSQVPIGFCNEMQTKFNFSIAYIPENLRLGKGIETFYRADRTVIGADSFEAQNEVKNLLSDFPTEFLLSNLVTAEMIKHANNIFLATSISFANEMARVGEYFGVDSQLVGKALKLDKRIGNAAYVAPGLGFAGGTLPRDLQVIQKIGKKYCIPTPLTDAVLQVNENTTQSLAEIILRRLKNSNFSKSVLILGYTYKADTDTLRRSLSLDLAHILHSKSTPVLGYDPVMNNKDLSSLKPFINHFSSLEEIPTAPAVIVIMTARAQFKEINWKTLSEKWNCKKISPLVLDTQNILHNTSLTQNAFDFQRLWAPIEKGLSS